MKGTLSKIALAVLTVGLLGSCSKINERLDNLDKRVDAIENEQIASINSQIANINSSIADLGQIRSDISSLKQSAETHGQEIFALQEADETLGNRIDNLEDYLDNVLPKYAEKEWVEATFSTLEQYEATCDTIAKIDARIGALDAKLGTASEKLSKDIKACADSLTKWVNKTFEGYYTAAQMDAKLAQMKSAVDSAKAAGKITDARADSLAGELAKVKSGVDSVKASIRAEYKAAIKAAIEESEGKLTKELTDKIATVNTAVTNLTTRVTKLEKDVTVLTGRVDKLEKMIQSVSIIPAYSDGSVDATKDGILYLDIIVEPATAVAGLTKDNFKVLVNEVKTKSVKVDTVAVEDISVDVAKGTVTARANILSNLSKLPESGKALTIAVNIKNGISHFTTEFVPVYVAPAPVVPEGFVDLGVKDANGKPLFWAEKNLGASKAEEYGKYFSWGDVTGQTQSESTFSTAFNWDNDVFGQTFNGVAQTIACPNGILAQTYDVAYQTNNACRMPTTEDFMKLAKQCFLEWTENYKGTGVKGVIVWKAKGDDAGWFKTSTDGKGREIKDDGSSYNAKEDHTFSNTYTIGTDPSVFFPAAGYGESTSLNNAGSVGTYWSSSLNTSSTSNAYNLSFNSDCVYPQSNSSRYRGSSVRPVTE